MDYIKKTICIEGARTRTQGLVPYYEFGKEYEVPFTGVSGYVSDLGLTIASGSNGNWGQFPANPWFLASENKTYEGMLSSYYSLLNVVRNSVKLRKVETKDGEIIYTEDTGTFYSDGPDCFVGGDEPEYLYDFAAYDADDFTFTEIDSEREEARRVYREITPGTVSGSHMYIVLINDFEKYMGVSGCSGVSSYLDNTKYSDLGTGIDIENGGENYKWARMCQVVDACIGKINIPSWIFNKHIKVPKSMPCADVAEYIDWLENYQTLSADCCNVRLWDDMGGEDMLKYLKTSASTKCDTMSEIIDGLPYAVPYIEMPLLLTQNYTDVGVLTNIDGVYYESGLTEEQRPHGIGSPSGFTIDEIVMGFGDTRYEYPTTEQFEADSARTFGVSGTTVRPIVVESQLEMLRDAKKYIDDKNNVLPGLFKKFDNPAGQMYSCVKMGDESFYELSTSSYTVPDKIVDGEMTYKELYAVVYVPTSNEHIVGMNNRMDSYTRVFDGNEGLETFAEAQSIVDEQRTNYDTGDPSNNEWHYRISVYEPIWTMSALTDYTPNQSKNADGYLSGDKLDGDEGLKYPPSDPYENPVKKYYRTITTPVAGIRIAQTEEDETRQPDSAKTHYFFCVKYNNSETTPMEMPYHSGNTANVYLMDSGGTNWLYRGDYIRKITPSGNSIEFEYVIGGRFYGDSAGTYASPVAGYGDVYYEKHNYEEKHKDLVPLDGVDNVPVWSEYIDFEADAKEFYSPRYGLYRTGNTANIIELASAEQWTAKDGDGDPYSYDAYLAKEDYLTAFSLPPKVDVNVTIDRGGVSVFEKHYKLSECNTMQDLVNYGNNFFNL